jgi:hypothetical protein
MRSYGRNSTGQWVEVTTDASGFDDMVWVTSLAQALKLSPGESPFYANVGIPAQQSVVSQIFPDFYVAQIQSRYAQYFASLSISRVPNSPTDNPASPSYKVNIVTNKGAVINQTIVT